MSTEDRTDQRNGSPQERPQDAGPARDSGPRDDRGRPDRGDRGDRGDRDDRGDRGDRGGYRGGGRGRSYFRRKVCRFCTQNLVADYYRDEARVGKKNKKKKT